MSYRKLMFKQKSKIRPQITLSCQILSTLLFHPSLKFIESIDYEKIILVTKGASKHFLINSKIKTSFFIIFGGARSPDGVRFSIRLI